MYRILQARHNVVMQFMMVIIDLPSTVMDVQNLRRNALLYFTDKAGVGAELTEPDSRSLN